MRTSLTLAVVFLAGCAVGDQGSQERAAGLERERVRPIGDDTVDAILRQAPPSPELDARLEKGPDLATVQEAAVARNPDLVAALERWVAALERSPQKLAPGNPMVGYEYSSMFKMHEVGTVVLLPFPTKLLTEAEAALADARVARAEFAERENELRAQAALAYANLWLAQRSLEIVTRNLALLDRFVATAEAKFKAGTATLPDTLRAQIERDGLRADRASLEREVYAARSALNVLLDRSPEAPLGPLAAMPSPVATETASVLLERALEQRPELEAAVERTNAADLMVSRARQEWLPDVQLGGSYIRAFGTENNFVRLIGGVSIPLFVGPIRARIREAEADARRTRAELRATRNRVLDEVAESWAMADAARERWRILSEDALPRAEDAIKASEVAYVAKQIEFLALIDTERQLLGKQLERERALADFAIARARLERALGAKLRGG